MVGELPRIIAIFTNELSSDTVLTDKMKSSAAGERIRVNPGRRVDE
jgi:hypothetical protein